MSELLAEPVILFMNLHMENILIASTIGNFVKIISNVFFVVFFKFDLWAFTFSRIIGSFCSLVYIVILLHLWYNICSTGGKE